MTIPQIQSAGYIVINNEAIWGYGETADAAWESFRREMDLGGVEIVGDDVDTSNLQGSYTRESDYRTQSASKALIESVGDLGGAIDYRIRNGVACTVAEDEAD